MRRDAKILLGIFGGLFLIYILVIGIASMTYHAPEKAPATTDTVSQPETSTNTATNSSSSSSTTPKYETYDFWYNVGKGDGQVGLNPDSEMKSGKWGDAYMDGWYVGHAEYERIHSAFN